MVVQDGFRNGTGAPSDRYVSSLALTALLALVGASSVLTVLASFYLHDSQPVLEVFLKFSNTMTLAAEILFVLAALLTSGERVLRGTALATPSRLELAVFAVLFVYVVASIVLRGDTVPPVESTWWIIHLLFFFALRVVWDSGVRFGFAPVWTAVAVAALIHVALFGYFISTVPNPETSDFAERFPGFTNIRHLAYFITPVATLIAAALLTGPKRLVLPLALALAVVLVYPGWTGGRGSLLAFLAAVFLLLVFKQARKPARILLIGVALAVAVTVPLLLPQIGPWPPILDRFGDLGEEVTVNDISTGRIRIWTLLVGEIAKQPVFGYGPVRVRDLLSEEGIDWLNNTHNVGLQILLHWGLVGLGLTLAVVAVHAKRIATAVRAGSREAILAFAVLSAILIHAQIDGSMYYPFTFVLSVLAFFNLWAIGGEADETGHAA